MVRRRTSLLGLVICCSLEGCASPPQARSSFDERANPPAIFEVDGAPLCFVGANNYYLAYKPRPMVDDVLASAVAMGVKVMRIWAFIDRGSLDGRVASVDRDGPEGGRYFQAWDAAQRRPVYNDGPSGLQGLDYALAKARQLHLKVVLVLTNNWREFGGMDQYLAWYGRASHDDFFTDTDVKQAYRDWLWHLVSRINGITAEAYRDDPTVFAWELANEPRGVAGTSSAVLSDWAREMSSYLKSIDSHHLVAVGDEGFLEGSSQHWTYHANNGVDHRALTALPQVDYGTFHMYPDTWGTGATWAEHWIDDHVKLARELGKPTVLEEYGLKVTRDAFGRVTDGLDERLKSYASWNERVFLRGGNAAMFWILAGRNLAGDLYRDYDHFSVYDGDQTSDLLGKYARRVAAEAPACTQAKSRTSEASPFVRVRSQRLSALKWPANDG